MPTMCLPEFLLSHQEAIIRECATFAKTLMPPGTGMTEAKLRDHAQKILTAVVQDMHLRQSPNEQHRTSQGHGTARSTEASRRLHAVDRIFQGYTFQAVLAEFRALRASVLRLYEETGATDLSEVRRLNEAIDEAQTESMGGFARETDLSQERQEFLLKISAALRPLNDPAQIKIAATRLLGEQLGVNRVFYADAEAGHWLVTKGYETGVDPLPDQPFTMSTYGDWIIESFKAGTRLVVSDMHADGRFQESERQAHLALQIGAEIAVPLVKAGELVAMLVTHNASPRQWSDQDIAMLDEAAERTWAAVERARAETASWQSEQKYRALFDSMDEGVTTVELLFDDRHHAVDAVYVETNPAVTRMTGLPADIKGRRVSEFSPNLEPFWLQTYARIVETGKPERFEHGSRDLGAWFDVYASRVGEAGSRQIVAVYRNITERKRREANLLFLSEVTQDLAGLTNLEDTIQGLGEKIGRFFTVKQCMFSEYTDRFQTVVASYGWHEPGARDLRGTYRSSEFLSEELMTALRNGQPFAVHDTQEDARVSADNYGALGVRSFITFPLQRDGVWLFQMSVLDDKAREWRDDEIELLRELTTRIWTRLERARAEAALVQSEEQYRTLFNSIDEGVGTVELIFDANDRVVDCVYREQNPAFQRQTGLSSDAIGRRISEAVPDLEPFWFETFERVHRTGEAERFEHAVATLERWFAVYVSRSGKAGSRRVVYVYNDITERKQREQRQAFLLQLGDAVGSLVDADAIHASVTTITKQFFRADRCFYCEVVGTDIIVRNDASSDGSPSVVGVYPLREFPIFKAVVEAGRPLAVTDTRTTDVLDAQLKQICLQLQIVAFIDVLIVRQGRPVGILSITQNTTRRWTAFEVELAREAAERTSAAVERAHIEAALRVSEERLRLLIEGVKDYAIFTLDLEGRITSWNEGARRMGGYTRDEVLGQPVSRFYLPDDAGKPDAEMQRALETGRSEDESWRVRKDGSRFWVNEIMRPLSDATGRFVGFAKISRDLTERKALEDALHQAHDSLEQRVRERTSQVQSLFQRLVSAQEEERRRIARDIHDQVGQQMSALRINLDALRSHAEGGTATAVVEQAERTQRLAEELDQSIDFLTWQLRPAALDHLGLSAALQNLVTGWAERFAIAADFAVDRVEDVRLPRDVEANLYRIAQEAMHNIAKHAHATEVTVYLTQQSNELVLLVEDNGRGFDTARRPDDGHMGLMNMRERAALVGGRLHIDSAAGHGTSIQVRIPDRTATNDER